MAAVTVCSDLGAQEDKICHCFYSPSISLEWLPTPAFLPGELHGQSSLANYSPQGCEEWDATERLTLSYYWAYTLRKPQFKKIHAPQISLQHCLQ